MIALFITICIVVGILAIACIELGDGEIAEFDYCDVAACEWDDWKPARDCA